MGKRKDPRKGKRKEPRMVRRRSLAWKNFTISQDDEFAFCKDCGSQFVAKTSAGTSHIGRHKNSCIGRQDGAAPPPGASNWEEATTVLPRQDGAPPPIALPPTTIAAPPLSALAESSSSNMGSNWEEATADLARTIAFHGFDPSYSFAEDGAPPPIASPPTVPAAPPLGAQPESSSCSKAANWEEEATADLARMIALHGYDPSIVEDSYFKSFVRRLSPDFQVPSRAAIEDICDGVCDEAKRVLECELERTSGKVSFAIDIAETALGKALYSACHFINEDWNRRMIMFEVMPLRLSDKGIILLDVSDYVSEVGVMLRLIRDYYSISDRVFSQAIGTVRDFYGCVQVARYETVYNHNAALEMVADCFLDNIHPDFSLDLGWSSTFEFEAARKERGEIDSQFGRDNLLPYDKTWISFYFSLEFIHKKKQGTDFSSPDHKAEKLLRNIFGAIYCAIKTISDPNSPTSNVVLRELFKVREALQSSLVDASGDEADFYKGNFFKDDVVDTLEKAKETLDESIEEEYLQWSIPLVLDPRYKIKNTQMFFIRAFSSEARDYIANIRNEIKELISSFSLDGGETTYEDQIDGTQITNAHQLELDRYLQDPLMKDTEDFDILNWWKLNSSNYPTLARMARAALAMPTCSKLSSEQMSQITSKIRGYSKEALVC